MLGKLIKNEFVQRWKSLVSVYGGLLGAAFLVFLFGAITDYGKSGPDILCMLFEIFMLVYVVGFYAGIPASVIMAFGDYNKRMFKDQGYLTHTLPVDISEVLIARLICDLCVCASVGIIAPVSLIIASGELKVFEEMADIVAWIMDSPNSDEIMKTIGTVIFTCAVGLLYFMWMYYMSYAVGHSYRTGKRWKSIGIYILTYLVSGTAVSVFSEELTDSNVSINAAIIVVDIMMLVCVCVFMVITGSTCKRRLNLE